MLQAFVGIVSHRGMEVFCPEDTATVRFLWRRVQRERGRSVCFWSVIPCEAVELIESAMNLGMTQGALHILQQFAREYGLFVPSQDETEWDCAACQR